MAAIMLQKPSRANNLSYLILGYYLSSIFSSGLSLPLEEQIVFITVFGSFLGTLVYYIKPIERVIALYLKLSKRNKTFPEEPYWGEFDPPVYKSEVLFSNYLQDDRTIVNGAFFMAIGTLASYNFLKLLGSSYLLIILLALAAMLSTVGLWEIYKLVNEKIPIVVFFYNYYNVSQNTLALEKAIQEKDWIEAKKIIAKEPELTDPAFQEWETVLPEGICKKCQSVKIGNYCTECGEKIEEKCPKCKNRIVKKGEKAFPRFCKHCGNKLVIETPQDYDD